MIVEALALAARGTRGWRFVAKMNEPSEREDTILAVANECAFGAGCDENAAVREPVDLQLVAVIENEDLAVDKVGEVEWLPSDVAPFFDDLFPTAL